MPYVEVWVDEVCDGECEASEEAKRLQHRIDEAERLIREGYYDAALHALTDTREVICKSPIEMAEQYKQWKTEGLDGFEPHRGLAQ